MGSIRAPPKRPWIETPLIPSHELSRAAGCNIFLKLENLQPSGSFKSRGIGNIISNVVTNSPSLEAHFYCSSGGNAGLACVHAATALGRPCTIVTPVTAPAFVLDRLRRLGARVEVVGADWTECDAHMRNVLMAADPHAVYVPPFDHPLVWEGHAWMVREMAAQSVARGMALHAVVASVGGGGLLNGLIQGIDAIDGMPTPKPWPTGSPPSVVAVETEGAHSLNASIRDGYHVTLPAITSIATSLGCAHVSDRTWDFARHKARIGTIPYGCPPPIEAAAVTEGSTTLDEPAVPEGSAVPEGEDSTVPKDSATPEASTASVVPSLPKASATPKVPTTAEAPTTVETPTKLEVPWTPDAPATPKTPTRAEGPTKLEDPPSPEGLATPQTPTTVEGPATPRITSSEGPAVVEDSATTEPVTPETPTPVDPAALEGVVVSDAEAAMACVRFADDARFLIEPACGATIATAYNGALRRVLGARLSDDEWRERNVILVVCGGSNITLDVLEGYRENYAALVEW